MKPLVWHKKGCVIAPDNTSAWRSAHAGMVSAIPRDRGFRVFMTGKSSAGSFQIGWLDLDRSLNLTQDNPANPVLTPGRMGCFDCQGLCMPSVVRVTDRVLYMYYAGWGLSAPGLFVNRCGLAISDDDGDTWRRWSEAPLDLIDEKDPIGIGTVFVLREANASWRMWYTTFREWRKTPEGYWRHYYHIKYAESEDGIHWRKPDDNIAIDFADDKEYAIGRPMVIRERDGYRMWFCTRSDGSSYRIGYAESSDGRTWIRHPSGIEPSASGWDSDMVEYAYVLKQDDDYIMFYNGNDFGGSGTGVAVASIGSDCYRSNSISRIITGQASSA